MTRAPQHTAISPGSVGVSRVWLAMLGLSGVVALCMGLGTLHQGQQADSLLLGLISTQLWTPFYWGQDRYGMLLPLLAAPVADPVANLVLQGWMMSTAALLSPFLVARFLCGRAEPWLTAGLLANALLLVFMARELQFEWFVPQPYALAIALGFTSLVVIEEARGWTARVTALLLMLLAFWVNVSVVIAIGPALLLRGRWTTRTLVVSALGMAGGVAAGLLAATPHATPTGLIKIREWPGAWLALLAAGWQATAHAWLLAPVLVASAAAALALRKRADLRPIRLAAAAAVGTAVANWLVVGAIKWVSLNGFFPRYLLPSFLMLAVAAALALVGFAPRSPRPLALGGSLVLVSLALLLYGAPSLSRVERDLDQRFGRMTPEILSSHATLVAGDYWAVWPAVFHANLALHRQQRAERVYGLSYRYWVTEGFWRGRPDPILVATAPGDETAVELAAAVDRQLDLVEHRSAIDLFTATPRPRASSPPTQAAEAPR